MKVRLLAFAYTAQQAGFSECVIESDATDTPRQLLQRAAPAVATEGLRVAVDCEYHDWDAPIGAASEVALIPPVSGG